MGHGSYTAYDWSKLKRSRKIDTSSTNELFTKTSMNPAFDPQFIGKREARDSEDHPDSTPIIIGVDVTGSMGYLSTEIIKNSLNELMNKLYSSDIIHDPQLLFAALGDAEHDSAPLQVTQFESDIRIAEQLLDLWLEGQGGPIPEDYELLWYFAARHTDIDCFNKRGKKGFCISIGDAPCHDSLSQRSIKKIFVEPVPDDISSKELAEAAMEKYEVFHIMLGDSPENFSAIIPGRVAVISKSEIKYLPEIIISIILLSQGHDKASVTGRWGNIASVVVEKALSLLSICTDDEIHF